MTHYFIERPIFSFVISALIFLAGLVSYIKLPVARFPDIVPPSIVVKAFYPGADPDTLVKTVAMPIEQKINGVDHMLYMQSAASGDGTYELTIFFEVGTDPDIAAVLVQNRVSMVISVLPESVVRRGIVVQKESPSALALFALCSKEDDRDELYLSNYASIFIRDELARLDGVGNAVLFDPKVFSMRIWLDTAFMAERNISVKDVAAVIQEQNVQIAAGSIGASPAPPGQVNTQLLRVKGRVAKPEEFQNLVVRTEENGALLKLKDIARVELGNYEYNRVSMFDGKETAGLYVYQAPGANAVKVMKSVNDKIEELRPMMEQNHLELVPVADATEFIHVSQEEVKETLIIAVILVIGIVFLFLQSFRAAIIPALTIPVSLVGCFFIMMIFHFSLNTLTLFGLVLVIGIVVDDAIVVVENTQRILNSESITSLDAAKKSIDQVVGPIIGTTCVLCSIFLPTMFAGGILGRLYIQFALTIVGAVLISTVCALTIAPALCALFLRPETEKKQFFIFRWFNAFFDRFAGMYSGLLRRCLRIPSIIFLLWILLIVALGFGSRLMPTGFIPDEDQGVIMLDIRLPDGASKERTLAVAKKLDAILKTIPAIEKRFLLTGYSKLESSVSENQLFGLLQLVSWEKRRNKNEQIDVLQRTLLEKFRREIPEATSFVYSQPVIEGIGKRSGIECYLLDKRGRGYDMLSDVSAAFLQKTSESGIFRGVKGTFRPDVPQLYLDIDREKVKRMGIRMDELFASVQTYLGTNYINDFNDFERNFHVVAMADGKDRQTIEQVLALPLMNAQRERVPLRSVASIREIAAPHSIIRYNLSTADAISAIPCPGISSDEAMAVLDEGAKRFPNGYALGWGGISFQERRIGSTVWFLFALALLFGFLSLAALYESWSAPLIIMMAVPLGVSGALLAVALRGAEINVYTQIGLILMIGLSAKNAILITEFARSEYREKGKTPVEAALSAGRLRLRPIMMTSFAFILGVVPLAIATGAGANGRQAIGTAVLGGMLEETMVGIIVTPVLFLLITRLADWGQWFRRKNRSHDKKGEIL